MSDYIHSLFLANSSIGWEYELVFWSITIICALVVLGVAFMITYSAIRYRRRSETELPPQIQGRVFVEVAWTIIPLIIFMGMFASGAHLYFTIYTPPPNAKEVYVVGKQWMWKLQHIDGAREINELHVPIGQPTKLIITSQDVIHSFYIPSFRIKMDAIPGRYTTVWIEPTRVGDFHLFCAEYCGTKHSGMIGWIHAMEPREYQTWVEKGGAEGSMVSLGEKMFHQFACANCHHFDNQPGNCPNLKGLFGGLVQLNDGRTVVADESYIRESILDPAAKIVAGYDNFMPNFTGQISEEQLAQLIAYVKALGGKPNPGIGGVGTSSISTTRPSLR